MNFQKLSWESSFLKSDQLYMIDGAEVVYDGRPGILYKHGMFPDQMPILEKPAHQFYPLPVGQRVAFELISEDEGLSPFLEVRFFKKGGRPGDFLSYMEKGSRQLEFVVPSYKDFLVRVRARGEGETRLILVRTQILTKD